MVRASPKYINQIYRLSDIFTRFTLIESPNLDYSQMKLVLHSFFHSRMGKKSYLPISPRKMKIIKQTAVMAKVKITLVCIPNTIIRFITNLQV